MNVKMRVICEDNNATNKQTNNNNNNNTKYYISCINNGDLGRQKGPHKHKTYMQVYSLWLTASR